MALVKHDTIPSVFNKKLQVIGYIYPTRQNNFAQSLINTNRQRMQYLPVDHISGITYCKQSQMSNIQSSFQRKNQEIASCFRE